MFPRKESALQTQERDVPARNRNRTLKPATRTLLVLAFFVCAIWGACAIITWAADNLPVWLIAGCAIGLISLFTIVEGSK